MRKEYEPPKAEKVEFNYKEIVVASMCKSGIAVYYDLEASSSGNCKGNVIGEGEGWISKEPQ